MIIGSVLSTRPIMGRPLEKSQPAIEDCLVLTPRVGDGNLLLQGQDVGLAAAD